MIKLSNGFHSKRPLNYKKRPPKKYFMDVYTDWCGPCQEATLIAYNG